MGGWLSQILTDCEKMLELLDEQPDISDEPGAPDLKVTKGEIEFGASSARRPAVFSADVQSVADDVHFSYGEDHGEALKGISFKAPMGASIALVRPFRFTAL